MPRFLTKDEEKSIMYAIQQAETQTSGEVRVHMEPLCSTKDPLDRAKEVFEQLKMHETDLRNGTIIYIATKDHKVAIWGDAGINEKVGQDFWYKELDIMIQHFTEGEYVKGLEKAIEGVGERLKEFFPYQEDDVNELPDNISYGEDEEEDEDDKN